MHICSLVMATALLAADCAYAQGAPKAVGQGDPALAKAFPTLKLYDAQGSPLRAAREDWAAASVLVRNDAGWQTWLSARQQAFDKWVSIPRDRADMIAGNAFKLFDPVSKIPVKWSIDMPQPSKTGPGGEEFWRAWVSRVRSHNLSRIQEAARLYRLTGNIRHRDWAISQLDFYAANYLNWPLQSWNGKARMMSQSLDEAAAVVELIDAVRLLSSEVDQQHKRDWQTRLFAPIVQNLFDFNQGVNNIALWHSCAIAMVALEYGDTALLERALNGSQGLNTLLKKGVTADYIWYEGSFSYNNYVIAAMTPLFVQASIKGKSYLVKTPMLIAQNMLLSPLQFRFDDGFLPTVGDTRGRSKAVDLGAYLAVARVLPTAIGILEAQRVKDWETLIDQPERNAPPPVRLPVVTSTLFEASRTAILKNDNWQAFVHYGQLTFAHAQAEVPGYELYAGSTPVAVDQGTVDYGSPWHEHYFRRAVAHNVPLIDGEGQELDRGAWLPGRLDHFDAAQTTMSVSQPAYRQGVDVARQIRLDGQDFVDATHVRLTDAGGRRRIGMVFNTDCQFDIDDTNIVHLKAATPPEGAGFSYWTDVQAGLAPAQWSATLICGNQKFLANFKAGKPHQLYRASAPATPLPKRRNAVYLELAGREADFEMRITPQGKQ
jgi:hypothetical protein